MTWRTYLTHPKVTTHRTAPHSTALQTNPKVKKSKKKRRDHHVLIPHYIRYQPCTPKLNPSVNPSLHPPLHPPPLISFLPFPISTNNNLCARARMCEYVSPHHQKVQGKVRSSSQQHQLPYLSML